MCQKHHVIVDTEISIILCLNVKALYINNFTVSMQFVKFKSYRVNTKN